MASVKSVMIKVELEMCNGCLSSGRKLIALSENTDLFLCLLGRDVVADPTSISLCWECSAILRNTRRFQQRIQIAQDIMQQSLNQEEHFCLSTLAINKTETHCNTDLYVNINNQRNHEINTRCEGIFHQDILNKQPAVKVETIEVKYENEHDSEFHVEDVDMESVLREKEENLNNITLNRTRSPSSTRDSSVTVYPLAKKPKSHDDNEIKTEEKSEVTNTEHVEDSATEVQRRPSTSVAVSSVQYSCEVCDKTFNHQESLKRHSRTHTDDKPYICQICDKRFNQNEYLRKHLSIHTGDKPHSCEICDKRFNRKEDLKNHLRTHTGDKSYSCELCDKRFSVQHHLKRHLRLHSDDKPYSCVICDKRFIQPEYLKQHLRTHSGDKPYCCEICGKSFNQTGHLKIHFRSHTGEKPYSCEICDKGFNGKGSLEKHLRAHTGEKPYRCEVCDKRFTQQTNLKRHLRTHTSDKPHSCEICDKRFNRKEDLKRHLSTHSGEKPYSCEVCNKRFNRQQYLKQHLRKHVD